MSDPVVHEGDEEVDGGAGAAGAGGRDKGSGNRTTAECLLILKYVNESEAVGKGPGDSVWEQIASNVGRDMKKNVNRTSTSTRDFFLMATGAIKVLRSQYSQTPGAILHPKKDFEKNSGDDFEKARNEYAVAVNGFSAGMDSASKKEHKVPKWVDMAVLKAGIPILWDYEFKTTQDAAGKALVAKNKFETEKEGEDRGVEKEKGG